MSRQDRQFGHARREEFDGTRELACQGTRAPVAVNLLYVRTKLQAVIAQRLLETNVLGRPFTLVELFQYRVGEGDPSSYAAYRPLEEAAVRTRHDVVARSFLRSFAIAWTGMVRARLTGGAVFNANIAFFPFALALRLVPGVRLVTFDDGFANIVPELSPYYADAALPGGGLKRRLLRLFLPRGAAAYVRSRSSRHFTIFAGRPNIVPADKVETLAFDWESLLAEEDRRRLERPVRGLLVGTKYDEWPEHLDIAGIVAALGDRIDLYLPHPRETIDLHPDRSVRLTSPAEAAIAFLARRGPVLVFHLDSSVAHVLAGHDNVEFRNVVPAWSLDQIKPVA